jgi:hypothetical protein
MQAAEKEAADAVAAANKAQERAYTQDVPALLQRFRDLAAQTAGLLHDGFHGYCAYLMRSLPTLEGKLGGECAGPCMCVCVVGRGPDKRGGQRSARRSRPSSSRRW